MYNKEKKVIIVEEDKDLASVLGCVVRMNRMEAIIFRNLKEALYYLYEQKIEGVAFIDLVGNVESLMDEIKKIKEKNPQLKIVVTTAYPHYLGVIKKAGFDYLLKPYSVQEILSFI